MSKGLQPEDKDLAAKLRQASAEASAPLASRARVAAAMEDHFATLAEASPTNATARKLWNLWRARHTELTEALDVATAEQAALATLEAEEPPR